MWNDGGLGSLGYGPTFGQVAITTVSFSGLAIAARININEDIWRSPQYGFASNKRERAITLLHELGHAYDFLTLRGSGGSTIRPFDWIPSIQEYNQTEVWTKCGVVRPAERP
jgi:hypothetical protein